MESPYCCCWLFVALVYLHIQSTLALRAPRYYGQNSDPHL